MFALLLTVILFKMDYRSWIKIFLTFPVWLNGLNVFDILGMMVNAFDILGMMVNVFDILGMMETYFMLKCLLRPGVVQCNSQLKQHDWIMEYVTYVKFLFTLTNATLCKLHTVKSEFRSWLPYITSIIKLWRKREQRRQRTLLGLVYSVMLISCCDTQFNVYRRRIPMTLEWQQTPKWHSLQNQLGLNNLSFPSPSPCSLLGICPTKPYYIFRHHKSQTGQICAKSSNYL
jgi:hypothetical protein